MTNNKNNTSIADNLSVASDNASNLPETKKNLSLKQLLKAQLLHHRFLFYMIISFIIITFSYTIVYAIITDNSNLPLFYNNNIPLSSVYISAQTDNIVYDDNTEITIDQVSSINDNIIIQITSNNVTTEFLPEQFILSRYEADTFTPVDYPTDNSNFVLSLENNKSNIKLMYPINSSGSDYIYTLSIFDSNKELISRTVLNPTYNKADSSLN